MRARSAEKTKPVAKPAAKQAVSETPAVVKV